MFLKWIKLRLAAILTQSLVFVFFFPQGNVLWISSLPFTVKWPLWCVDMAVHYSLTCFSGCIRFDSNHKWHSLRNRFAHWCMKSITSIMITFSNSPEPRFGVPACIHCKSFTGTLQSLKRIKRALCFTPFSAYNIFFLSYYCYRLHNYIGFYGLQFKICRCHLADVLNI